MIAYQFQVNLDVVRAPTHPRLHTCCRWALNQPTFNPGTQDLLMQYANDELPTWPNIEMWFEILDYIEENLEDVCIGGAGAAYQHMEEDRPAPSLPHPLPLPPDTRTPARLRSTQTSQGSRGPSQGPWLGGQWRAQSMAFLIDYS